MKSSTGSQRVYVSMLCTEIIPTLWVPTYDSDGALGYLRLQHLNYRRVGLSFAPSMQATTGFSTHHFFFESKLDECILYAWLHEVNLRETFQAGSLSVRQISPKTFLKLGFHSSFRKPLLMKFSLTGSIAISLSKRITPRVDTCVTSTLIG